MSKNTTIICLLTLLLVCDSSIAEEEYYEINGVKIAKDRVTIDHKNIVRSEKTASMPKFQEDVFVVDAKMGGMIVKYARYLNSPDNFSGKHPSLTNTSMGVGIGTKRGSWWMGETLGISINGKNVFVEKEASDIQWKDGYDFARFRFMWNVPEADVVLYVAVPKGKETAYINFEIKPKQKIDSIKILLRCFPCAMASGPDGRPSHRWVSTMGDSVEVRNGQKGSKLMFSVKKRWVFYADKYHDKGKGRGYGPAALVLRPGQKVSGWVDVTDYGVGTWLEYSPDLREISFAIHSFTDIPNKNAHKKVVASSLKDQRILNSLVFWE